MNNKPTYYLVYSPDTAEKLRKINPRAPFYVDFGFYISGCPLEPDKIVYKGNYYNCYIVMQMLLSIILEGRNN